MDNIKAVVFDCDGVMFNSQKANLDFYNTILEHFAVVPVTHEYPDKVKLCHTASSPQVLLGLLGADLGRAAIEYAQQVDYDQFIPQLQMEDGLIELLPQLLQHFKLAVATNRGDSMLKILDYFEINGMVACV
ncbi:MAG: hypothetical protein B6I36_02815 [Desulfobacteraceae bacterium 4572_35.1]|nr:MAG: hypothetical protein B6I36_02815 [Desulfobacteraceae bacterium 4572_35.1]